MDPNRAIGRDGTADTLRALEIGAGAGVEMHAYPEHDTSLTIRKREAARAHRTAGQPTPQDIPSRDILGIPIAMTHYAQAMDVMDGMVARRERGYVCAVAVHAVMVSQHDPEMRRAVTGSTLTVPDGMPLVWAANLLGEDLRNRVYGPELMDRYCGRCAERGHRVWLYGGRDQGSLMQLALNLRRRHPGIEIVGGYSPPFRPLSGEEEDAIVDQINREFEPKVTAVLAGTAVIFPNHDDVRHQVYSFSPAKRFELPLYAGVPSKPVVFDRPGVVVLGCNIHDWMVGYVYVSDSPYFAKTGKDGKALLTDLSPRVYVVRVWHPQLEGTEEATKKNVDASRSRSVEVSWTVKLKPEARIRRAPVADRSGRY